MRINSGILVLGILFTPFLQSALKLKVALPLVEAASKTLQEQVKATAALNLTTEKAVSSTTISNSLAAHKEAITHVSSQNAQASFAAQTAHNIQQLASLNAQTAQYVQLNIAQIQVLNRFTVKDWCDFLQKMPGIQLNSNIFQLYSFYQILGFREYIQCLPDCNAEMIALHEKLNSASTLFDHQLFNRLENTEYGIRIFEMINKSQAVAVYSARSAAKFAIEQGKLTLAQQKDSLTSLMLQRVQLAEKIKALTVHIQKNIQTFKNSFFPWRRIQAAKELNKNQFDYFVQLQNYKALHLKLNHAQKMLHYAKINEFNKSAFTCAETYLKDVQDNKGAASSAKELAQKRFNAIHDKNYQVERVVLTPQAEQLAKNVGLDVNKLNNVGLANNVFGQVHSEAIQFINRAAQEKMQWLNHKQCSEIIDATVKIAHSSIKQAQQGNVATSWAFIDFANSILDSLPTVAQKIETGVRAAVKGVVSGSKNVVHLIAHPLETMQNIVFGVLKIASVLDDSGLSMDPCSFTLETNARNIQDLERRSLQIAQSVNELTKTIEQMTPVQCIEKSAECVTEWFMLDGVLKACHAVGSTAINHTNNILKVAVTNTKTVQLADATSALSKGLEKLTVAVDSQSTKISEIVGNATQTAEKIGGTQWWSTYQNKWAGNVIKEFDSRKLNLKSILEHMFKEKHALQKLNLSQQEIFDKFIDIIKTADAKNLLKNGVTNQIRTTINGVQIEIRTHIVDGSLININAFVGYSERSMGNTIYF